MVSMYEILLANWAPPCRVLLEEISEFFALFLVLYRCVAGFAVLNVITAVFIQQTMDIARNNNHIKVMQKTKAHHLNKQRLSTLFEGLAGSVDGQLSREELGHLMEDKQHLDLMCILDMDPEHVEILFDMFDKGDGKISKEEFVL